MKLIVDIIEKFGTDSVLHFMGGGWIVSMFTPLGCVGTLIGFVIMFVLSYIKEKYFDDYFDWNEIFAASLGGGVSILICALFRLIFI